MSSKKQTNAKTLNPPAIIVKDGYEVLDQKTGRVFKVKERALFEAFIRKDSGRYIKA